jgi:hypothetical protein
VFNQKSLVSTALVFSLILSAGFAQAQAKAGLPGDLFVSAAPQGAVEVAEARKSASEGKPITLHGKIGGIHSPFADKFAIFVLSDMKLEQCADGCTAPCVPKEVILANIATIQVVGSDGKPLRVSMKGVNGLNAQTEVTVQGTVAKRDANMMIVNAKNIHVNGNK